MAAATMDALPLKQLGSSIVSTESTAVIAPFSAHLLALKRALAHALLHLHIYTYCVSFFQLQLFLITVVYFKVLTVVGFFGVSGKNCARQSSTRFAAYSRICSA